MSELSTVARKLVEEAKSLKGDRTPLTTRPHERRSKHFRPPSTSFSFAYERTERKGVGGGGACRDDASRPICSCVLRMATTPLPPIPLEPTFQQTAVVRDGST